jgi:sugar O-acyltransferase (sialic acid O-acetyltransferase NeuD family)
MKNLVIIGARGYGREVYNLATQCKGFNKEYVIKGFLDDNTEALNSFEGYPQIISPVEIYVPKENDIFVCALGSVKWKKHYVELILAKGGTFTNLIHPTSIINSNVKTGNGLIVFMYSNISNDCTIGDFVTIQGFVGIGHDTIIGNWSHLNAYSFMGGYAVLEEQVCLNTRATILPKIKVGKNAIIGAGSIVLRNVKPNTTVFGNPAKKIEF